MHITFAPKGFLQIDDARITYCNFAGAGTQFNREGDRNFSVIIDDEEIADALVEAGWNVRIKPPRNEGDKPFMHLPVKIKVNERGPNFYLVSGKAMVRLEGDAINCLDNVDILSVSLDVRPYDWELPNGKTGRSAYLQSIRVTQRVNDRFAEEYAQYNDEM